MKIDFNLIWLILSIFWTIIVAIFTVLYWINFARVFFLEREINRLYKERDDKVKEIREAPTSTHIIEVKTHMTLRNYNERIEPLERKRRFIMEKLPFLRK